MKLYLIQESLTPCTAAEIADAAVPYAAAVSPDEYIANHDLFNMVSDIEVDIRHISETKVVVNCDSLAGTLNIPDCSRLTQEKFKLGFILDDTGIVLIGGDSYAEELTENIRANRKWRLPSLERFIYDCLEETIRPDAGLLDQLQNELDGIEDEILTGNVEKYPVRLNEIRDILLDLHMHYEHMYDLAKEFEENENGFFEEENLRYFRLFSERVQRLQDRTVYMRDSIVQIRSMFGEQLSMRQNEIMQWLTVVATVFMPLTVIAGWFGMNFMNMPSINSAWGYPLTIIGSVLIVAAFLVYFRWKKWI